MLHAHVYNIFRLKVCNFERAYVMILLVRHLVSFDIVV
jgi:hypothetical protein